MREQVMVYKGKVYIATDFAYELDRYKGEPLMLSDGTTIFSDMDIDGFSRNSDGLTEAEQWIVDNVQPNKVEARLKKKIYGESYDLNDILL